MRVSNGGKSARDLQGFFYAFYSHHIVFAYGMQPHSRYAV